MNRDTDATESTDTRPQATEGVADGGMEPSTPGGAVRQSAGPALRTSAAVTWLADRFDAISYDWVRASFAFVFLYFGLQKWPVVQGASPVRPPVKAFVEAVGFGGWIPLPAHTGLLLIGIYEVTLGALWFGTFLEERLLGRSRVFAAAGAMTVAHILVTFLPLALVPGVAFRQTQLWLPVLGTLPLPVALDWLSAFILKNLLFAGAFLYCYVEWAERYWTAPGRDG